MDTALRTIVAVASIVADQGNSIESLASAANTSNVSVAECFKLVQHGPLPFLALAQKYGYPGEQHKVITEDGYILTVFRIPGNRKGLPILLMHGVSDSADTWILRANTSLSITLAGEGYDVWLGNTRGNKYSLGHVSLDAEQNQAQYWNFTLNEHGKYDLAATIDYVLEQTGAEKLNGIGHSQGNTIFYVLCSTRPEYNEKINLVIALAPIAYLTNVPPPVSTAIQNAKKIKLLLDALNVYKLLDENSTITRSLRLICPQPSIGYQICALGLFFPSSGFDADEFGPCFLRHMIEYYPTGTSVKNLYHLAQISLRKKFAQYDYGMLLNKIAYNTFVPPEYNLNKMTTKVALLAARNDHLSTLDDVDTLRQQLPNVVCYKIVSRPQCNHIDYVYGKHMTDYIYPDIFEMLRVFGGD